MNKIFDKNITATAPTSGFAYFTQMDLKNLDLKLYGENCDL